MATFVDLEVVKIMLAAALGDKMLFFYAYLCQSITVNMISGRLHGFICRMNLVCTVLRRRKCGELLVRCLRVSRILQ